MLSIVKRRNPVAFAPMTSLWDEMERIFDNRFFRRLEYNDHSVRTPQVRVSRDDDAYLLEAEIPGTDPEDLKVSLADDNISIETKQESESDDGKYSSRFYRSFTLPADVDAEAVTGNYKNGKLTLRLERKHKSKARVLEITRG